MSQIGKNDFDNLLLFLWSKKTLIIRVTFVGFILGIVVAFLIPPTYKSESTFFVPSSASLSRVFIGVMPSTPASGDNLMGFSDDAPVEFYLQMLESRRMRDVLNQSLHLDQVFGIAKDHPNYDFVLQKQFQEYFNFSRTPNNAIKISTYFSNPETAQAMNEAVLKSINTVRNEVVKERGIAALSHIDRELDSLENVVVSYSERLKPYHDKGIFDYKLQTDRLTQGYATALANGGNKQALEEQFKILGEDGAAFESLYSDFKAVLEVKALL
jgi:LPS O-antigen subunit length determinant protein (WzzB/FepE family)